MPEMLQITLPDGSSKQVPAGTSIADFDRITMTGWCDGAGYRVGFGEVTGRILPARG